MPKTVRFLVTRPGIALLLEELQDSMPRALYAELLEQLLAAAAILDSGSAHSTELPLAPEHAQPFREWCQRAEIRENAGGNRPKARAFHRIRMSTH